MLYCSSGFCNYLTVIRQSTYKYWSVWVLWLLDSQTAHKHCSVSLDFATSRQSNRVVFTLGFVLSPLFPTVPPIIVSGLRIDSVLQIQELMAGVLCPRLWPFYRHNTRINGRSTLPKDVTILQMQYKNWWQENFAQGCDHSSNPQAQILPVLEVQMCIIALLCPPPPFFFSFSAAHSPHIFLTFLLHTWQN